MNLGQFERAELAAFAYRQARHTGSLDCIKAICYVMRNRVAAGWNTGSGSVLAIINNHAVCDGNEGSEAWTTEPDLEDRLLQVIVRDIDDIYLGTSDDQTRKAVGDAVYYHFVDKPLRDWFTERILRDSTNHPGIATIHTMRLFR